MDTIGEIRQFAGTYAPDGWVMCDGRALNISEYEPFFQLIGTTYGGDGQTYFKVPDLQGRVPIGAGQGAGLPDYTLGEAGGTETNTLTTGNMPVHSHDYRGIGILISCEDGHETTLNGGNYPAVSSRNIYSTIADGQMAETIEITSLEIGNTGAAIPVPNVQPYLTISYIICCTGIYPQP
jgi:microcystin-dependent protein